MASSAEKLIKKNTFGMALESNEGVAEGVSGLMVLSNLDVRNRELVEKLI